MMLSDDDLAEAIRRKKREQALSDATRQGATGGGLAGVVAGVGSGLAGGQKSWRGLALNALAHGAAGAGIGAGAQYLGQSLAGGDDDGGGSHATRGLLGGALVGGLGGAALGGLLGHGKLGWLSKAAPAVEHLFGQHALDNVAVAELKKMLAQGQKGRLAAALGVGGAAVGGVQGWETGADADYARSLEDDDGRY